MIDLILKAFLCASFLMDAVCNFILISIIFRPKNEFREYLYMILRFKILFFTLVVLFALLVYS